MVYEKPSLIQSADDAEGSGGYVGGEFKQLRSDAGKTDGTTLMRYIRIFSELSNQLRYASQKRVLVEVALIKLTRPSMEPNLDAILQRLGDLEAQMEDLEAGRMAIPMAAVYQEAGSALAGQAPRTGAGPGRMGNSTPGGCAVCRDFRQIPGLHPKRWLFPRPSWKTWKLVRNEWAKIVRSMGGGARSYLRDTVVEPGRRRLPDHRVYGSHELRYG